MFKHIWHVTYDEHEQKFKNLPEVFEQLLDGSNIRSVLAAWRLRYWYLIKNNPSPYLYRHLG